MGVQNYKLFMVLICIFASIIFFPLLASSQQQQLRPPIKPQGPIPKDAKLIYASKEYKCEVWEAGPHLYKAARQFNDDHTVNWVDISPFIEPHHLAQGFVDVLVTVDMHKIEGVELPKWYMLGDMDNGQNNDIRAYCDGVFYDLIDTEFKTFTGNVFETEASTGQYVTLRFGLPKKIRSYYKIFIGKGSIAIVTSPYPNATDWAQVKLYLAPPTNKVFASPNVLNVPVVYEKNKRMALVTTNTPLIFDGGDCVSFAGIEIVDYIWSFDYEKNPLGDKGGKTVSWRYATPGIKKVVLTVVGYDVEKSSYIISKSIGVPEASKSSLPLPLYVYVLEDAAALEEHGVKLFSPAPNPFIPARYPEVHIPYKIDKPGRVVLKIYTFSGELVKTLVDEEKSPGVWEASWDGTNMDNVSVATGVYFYRLEVGGEYRASGKIALVR